MSDIAELQQRVKVAGQRFGRLAEQDRKHRARLSQLVAAVEEGFARSQREIERLGRDLARADEENQQLQSMLQTLLAALESGGEDNIGEAMREIEARISRLVTTATAIGDSLDPGGGESTRASAEPPAPEGSAAEAAPLSAAMSAEPGEDGPSPAGIPSDEDLSAVNRIIQRISLLTGEFVEPDEEPTDAPEGEAAARDGEDGEDRAAG